MKAAKKHSQAFALLSGINVVLMKGRNISRKLLYDENTDIFFFFVEVIHGFKLTFLYPGPYSTSDGKRKRARISELNS
jgi:hypothetical protein